MCFASLKGASSPYINHFIQPDSIIPGMAYPQNWNRYTYVNNSPVNFTDPSGHDPYSTCGGNPNCVSWVESNPWTDFTLSETPLLVFSNEENQSFTPSETKTFNSKAWDIANALAKEINDECDSVGEAMGRCIRISPQEAFYNVFGGPISVKRVSGTCGCWAQHQGKNADGLYEIWVYSSTSEQEILSHVNLIVHEIGHAFYWAAGGFIPGSSVGERNGFYGPYFQWQFGLDTEEDYGTEKFADMFLGWVYGKWEEDPNRLNGLSINGEKKSAYMDKYMPLMVNKAIGR